MTGSDELAFLSTNLLRNAEGTCPRRIARELDPDPESRRSASSRPYNRARVDNAILDAITDAHRTPFAFDPAALTVPNTLYEEEQAFVRHALDWYAVMFGGEPFHLEPGAAPMKTTIRRLGVSMFGDVGIAGVDADGRPELRRLGRDLAPDYDPRADPFVRVALLRLNPWAAGRSVRVVIADLLYGARSEFAFDYATEVAPLVAWFESQLATLRERADENVAKPGADCASCKFVSRCPAHPTGANGMTGRDGLVPGVITLNPTVVETWRSCARRYRNRHLLNLQGSNVQSGSETGLLTHDLLDLLHARADEPDDETVAELLRDEAISSPTIDAMLHAHLERTPRGATPVARERTYARAQGRPAPPFMATARLDAIWDHDGVLDVRDYKTGKPRDARVADDLRARVQAWVIAPEAIAMGRRLQLRYEFLAAPADDEPERFEPEADDLEAIGEELRLVAAAIRGADREHAFLGVNDPDVCRWCEFRAICPDSATPADTTWPSPLTEDV
jgi:hypothetical protein